MQEWAQEAIRDTTHRYIKIASRAIVTGAIIATLGFTGLGAVVWFYREVVDWSHFLIQGAFVAVVVGALMIGVGLLARKGRNIEEAYRLGYDLGYELGFQRGVKAAAVVEAAQIAAVADVPTQRSRVRNALRG